MYNCPRVAAATKLHLLEGKVEKLLLLHATRFQRQRSKLEAMNQMQSVLDVKIKATAAPVSDSFNSITLSTPVR